MQYYVGVDGGGTKTAFAVTDAQGKQIATLQKSGCSYQTMGVAAAAALVEAGVRECLEQEGLHLKDCAGCCLGMPCYGEFPIQDQALLAALCKALAPAPVYVVNDVEIGWAGALNCGEGIYLVAGTGSIAFGKNAMGGTARCGGWPEMFGDEGSCYWIGREAMSLFSKQADGRMPKGALYAIVMEAFSLQQAKDFMALAVNNILPYRERVADFQRLAYAAAQQGDCAAANLYDYAAQELALLAAGLKQQLFASNDTVCVSYGGGLFKADSLILKPLHKKLEHMGCTLRAPLHSAVEGALILAKKRLQ